MDDGEKHQARLCGAKMVEELDVGRRSKWGQNIHHHNHSMQELKIGLQDLVLELSSEKGSGS